METLPNPREEPAFRKGGGLFWFEFRISILFIFLPYFIRGVGKASILRRDDAALSLPSHPPTQLRQTRLHQRPQLPAAQTRVFTS
jgi:hypothetical protein